ncbi:MAG: glycosyltransferase, partial [Crenarchaeota archaeon]|nr:glycosyltransferase [Thermoproteota archaeon]
MKHKMTIVHVAEAWKGGVATYVENVINAQVKDGHRVTLLVDKNNFETDVRQLDCDITFFYGSRNPAKMFNVSKEVFTLLKVLSPDLIHSHSTFAGVYCRLQKPIAKTIYTPHAWSFYKEDVSPFHKKIYQWIEQYLAKHTDRIICISQEEINAALKAGIPQNKLSLLYTG